MEFIGTNKHPSSRGCFKLLADFYKERDEDFIFSLKNTVE